MDFLNKAFAQVTDLVRSMTPAARITAALLVGVIVVCLALLFRLPSSTADEFLLGGEAFASSDIRLMEEAFAKAKLGGYEVVGNRVRVPRGKKVDYLAALAEHDGLPANFETHINQALGGGNAFEPKDQREAKLRNAKQQYLSLVVARMHGVENATVTYDEVDQGGFPRRKERSAMVAVWPQSNQPLNEEQVRTIRDLVASAFAGLAPAHVTVVDQRAGVSHTGFDRDGRPSPGQDPYRLAKRHYEDDWRHKIVDRLKMIPGVVVAVNVELDPELDRAEVSTKFDPKTVNIATHDATRESTTVNRSPGGRPGAAPNGVGPNSATAVSSVEQVEQRTNENETTARSLASREEVTMRKASLVPKLVAVTIDVPRSHYLQVWRENNPTPAGQEPKQPTEAELKRIEDETMKRIEEAVVQLLPPRPPGDNVYKPIMVSSFHDLPVAAPPPPALAATATSWLGANWQTLGVLLAGGFSLVMLRSMVRSATAAGGPRGDDGAAGDEAGPRLSMVGGDDEDDDEEEIERRLQRRLRGKGPDLRSELASMVKEDPDAAVAVLRNWIGDVG